MRERAVRDGAVSEPLHRETMNAERDRLRLEFRTRIADMLYMPVADVERDYTLPELEEILRTTESGREFLDELALVAGQDCQRMSKEIELPAGDAKIHLAHFDELFQSLCPADKEHLAMRWLSDPESLREWLERMAAQGAFKKELCKKLEIDGNPFDDASYEQIHAATVADPEFAVRLISQASADGERMAHAVDIAYTKRDARELFVTLFKSLNNAEQLHFSLLWLKDPHTSQHLVETMAVLDRGLHGFRNEIKACAATHHLSEEAVRTIVLKTGLLHDLGKLKVPDRVLTDDTPWGASPHPLSVGEILTATAHRRGERDSAEKITRSLALYNIPPTGSFRDALEHQGASQKFVDTAAGWQHTAVSCLCGHHHPRAHDADEVPAAWRSLLHVVRLADHHVAVSQDRPYKPAKSIDTMFVWMAKDYRNAPDMETALTVRWMQAALADMPPKRRLRVASAVSTKLVETILELKVTDRDGAIDIKALDARRHLRQIQDAMTDDAVMSTRLFGAHDIAQARSVLHVARGGILRDIPKPSVPSTGPSVREAALREARRQETSERLARGSRSFDPADIEADLAEMDRIA